MTTCVLCKTEATTTVFYGLPVCAEHYEGFVKECDQFVTLTEWMLAKSGPITTAILFVALERFEERWLAQDLSALAGEGDKEVVCRE